MRTYQSVHLIGRMGQDPDVRYTADGLAVATFSLATDRRVKPGSDSIVDWHPVGVSSDILRP